MKKALLYLTLSLLSVIAYNQSSIKGTVTDSVEKKNPENAVISLMRQTDSVLVKYTRADKGGHFLLTNLKEGKYILMITHPFMGDYFDQVDVKSGLNEIGKVYVTPKS
ncbi:MAG TPA: carboxypeptidase-like regulatory domain-containing protein, partial [Chitinophagaceae bacterium]|nr:carboxypeptidase-like regulatory domain-containing protein [Chitinophagaceae bacterium]